MPKMWVEGLEEFGDAMVKADEQVMNALKMAVYDGAHVLFMEVENQIRSLPTDDNKSKHRDITPAQKQGLIDGLYGSTITVENGNVYEYIGFTGYNSVKTKEHPNGQPNIMIARSVESGGSYMNKRVFMTKAAHYARPKALAATRATFEEQMEKLNR